MSKVKTISKGKTISKERIISKQQNKLDSYFSESIGSKTYDKSFKRAINQLERDMEDEEQIKTAYDIYKTQRNYRPIKNKFAELEKIQTKQKAINDKIEDYEKKDQTDFTIKQIKKNKEKLAQLDRQEKKAIDYLERKDAYSD